jgi:DNA-binding transcriptional LysR family regulator
MLLVVGKSHPLASKPKLSIQDFRSLDFVMMGGSESVVQELQRFCGDELFEPSVVHLCGQLATAKAIVALGQTATILPQGTITPDDRMRLVGKPLVGHNPSRDICVIRHHLRYQSQGTEQFLKILREHTEPQKLPPLPPASLRY